MEKLYFKIENNILDYDGHLKYEDNEYIIVAEGNLYLRDRNISLKQVAAYLRENKNIADIDGLYSMIVFNKPNKKIIALQDIFSYIHPLYYSINDNGICIALFLRQVVLDTKMWPCLNRENITEFLYNGFLTDDRCLLSKIKKVPAMHVMIYDDCSRTVSYEKRTYSIKTDINDESDYFQLIEENLRESLDGKSAISMALSSGFDSNFLLHCINKIKPSCKVNAYTVGAANGNDETQNVKKICSYHSEVTLKIKRVTPNALQSFPQMVYELEDSVFERGIFLQYVLSNYLLENGERSLLLGEGADQILSFEFKTSANPYYFVGIEKHYPWVYYPYEMLTYIILKKNGIFLRNRDIRAYYPFLKANFIRGVSKFRKMNGTNKEHYKAYIANSVGKEVGEILIKRPGSTNLSTLFNHKNQRLLDVAKQSYLYDLLPRQPDRDSGNEVELDNCLKVFFLMIFEEIFCKQEIKNLENDYINSSLDMMLNKIIQRGTKCQ